LTRIVDWFGWCKWKFVMCWERTRKYMNNQIMCMVCILLEMWELVSVISPNMLWVSIQLNYRISVDFEQLGLVMWILFCQCTWNNVGLYLHKFEAFLERSSLVVNDQSHIGCYNQNKPILGRLSSWSISLEVGISVSLIWLMPLINVNQVVVSHK